MKSLLALVSVVTFLSGANARAAGVVNQTITLRPGWNAIWLEVTPTNTSPAAVFNGVSIASVWGWSTRLTTADFIQDAGEPVWNADLMQMYVPPPGAGQPPNGSFQNSLHALRGNRPYYVKYTGTTTLNLTVTGAPEVDFQSWQPNVFNLRGFPVNPASPPTFQNFFRHSPAHFANNQLQPIYALNASGVWELVAPTALMQSGAAYWVRCNGASEYIAPIEGRVAGTRSLDFGTDLSELTLELVNRRATSTSIEMNGLAVPTNAISVVTSSQTQGLIYTPVTGQQSRSLLPNNRAAVVLRINRPKLAADELAEVATLTDGQGTRLWMPLNAIRVVVGSENDPNFREAKSRAGLWIGYVDVTGVSEAHSGVLVTNQVVGSGGLTHDEVVRVGAGTIPTPVAQPFRLKLMLHVDTNGTSRLLKEVIQMFVERTFTNDVDGVGLLDQPGRLALITDDALLPRFQGSLLIDGKLVGRRLSTADFDFPVVSSNNFLAMSGYLAVSNTVRGTITLSPNLPTNPFRHKFHPDHDNLGPDFRSTAARQEVYEVSREIELMPTADHPEGKTPPEYGDETISGNYREVVSGLHRVNIVSAGTFHLQRISPVGVLNQ